MRRRDPDPDWSKMTVSIAALAGFFGVSEAAVLKWGRVNGMPRGTEKGRYPFHECVMWRIDRLTADTGESGDIVEERRKLIISQRLHQELENGKLRDELYEAEVVKSVFRQALSTIATQLDGLAPRITPRLAMLSDPAQIQRMLFDECRVIRNAGADALQDMLVASAGSGDPENPAEEERRAVGRRKPGAATRKPGAGTVED